jgi:hypothetical protein
MTEERRCTAAKNRAEFSGALGTWTYGYAQTQMGAVAYAPTGPIPTGQQPKAPDDPLPAVIRLSTIA